MSLTNGGITEDDKPGGRFKYNNSLIGEYKNAVFTSILDISRLDDVARLSYTLILRAEAVSAKVLKYVDSD